MVSSDIGKGTLSSVACFGSGGTCNDHLLHNCTGEQKIAIIDAYYTNNKQCINKCLQNLTNTPEDTNRTPLTPLQLKLVDEACTFTGKCSSKAQLGPESKIVSVLKYLCKDGHNQIEMCNGTKKSGSDITLMFARKNLNTECTCYITTETSESVHVDVHLLNMTLTSTPCTTLSVHLDENERKYNCTTPFTPYRLLANGTLKRRTCPRITIQNPGNFSLVWIQITGSQNFMVTCSDSGPVDRGQDFDACDYHATTGPALDQSSTQDWPSMTGSQVTTEAVVDSNDSSTVAVVSGVIAAVLVVVAIVLVVLWFKYKRNRGAKSNPSLSQKPGDNYSLATPISDHNYHEIETPGTGKTGSNYDYATVNGEPTHTGKKLSPQSEDDYDHVGTEPPTNTGHYDTSLSAPVSSNWKAPAVKEDDYSYNHLTENGKKKNNDKGVNSPGYDTAASASEALQKFWTKGASDVDNYYGYNHTGKHLQPKHLKGEYDTTESAAKAVAQMLEKNNHKENDYDHFQQTKSGVQASDSPYDIAEHQAVSDYSVAGALHKHDPYDFAK